LATVVPDSPMLTRSAFMACNFDKLCTPEKPRLAIFE
jgi:hypothetical protein